MKQIGGFFELELNYKKEYHDKAIKLNTGRNALEYILRANEYRKVYLPYYICSSVLEPLNKLNQNFEYYTIDINFNAQVDFKKIKSDELLIYVNYFGVCDSKVDELVEKKKLYGFNLCIDNTQSFFSFPKEDVDTIYSARKFFGCPDGAYLYTKVLLDESLERETGYDKSTHLLKRIDLGPNNSYSDFKKNGNCYINQPIKHISKLSEKILGSIDYDEVMKKRWRNFHYIHSFLGEYNEIKLDIDTIKCPMVYPFICLNSFKLRDFLIENGVFVAQYWKSVLGIVETNSYENIITNNLIPIPIDQRYCIKDMKYIVELMKRRGLNGK